MNREQAHKFFTGILEASPDDPYVLVDIIVNYCLFPTDRDEQSSKLDDVVREVHEMEKGNGPNKILAIKMIREKLGWGLKDAKDFYENGFVSGTLAAKPTPRVEEIIAKIKKDYRL